MDKTIQRADEKPYGTNYRVCPETTETQMNVQACFAVNGTVDAPVTIQTVLPNLTNFKVFCCCIFTLHQFQLLAQVPQAV